MKNLLHTVAMLSIVGGVFADEPKDTSLQSTPESIECLAKNIYFEARNQSVTGMIAIGYVTLERVRHRHYPNTICDVVWDQRFSKKHGRLIPHFSWTLDGLSDRPKNKKAYEMATRIATSLLSQDGGLIHNPVKGAIMFHATYVSPNWKDHYTYVKTIGDHVFYK